MILEVQIQSLIYSFVYGFFFSILLNYNYKFLFKSNNYYKIIINILFILDNVLLYYIILKYINNGVIHVYFFIMIVLGVIFGNYYSKKVRK